MSAPQDLPADIAVFAGTFESQPLVFAHLLDEAPNLDFDQIEVLQDRGIRKRLEGFFPPETVTRLLVALDEDDTLVLLMPDAGVFPGSVRLTPLGFAQGTLRRA